MVLCPALTGWLGRHKNAPLPCDRSWRWRRVWDKQGASAISESVEKARLSALTGKSMKPLAGPDFASAGGRARTVGTMLALLAAAAILSACHSVVGTKAQYAADQPAGELYNKGLAYMNAG